MFGRKKYRKGREYTYVVGGTFSSGKYTGVQDKIFINSKKLTIINSMDAYEMFEEVMRHVKDSQNVSQDHAVFLTFYHVERN